MDTRFSSDKYFGECSTVVSPSYAAGMNSRLDWSKIAAVGLVKNEQELIYKNLTHLACYGIRRFVIADNLSSDDTRSEIDRFRSEFVDAAVIVVDDPVEAYIQSSKLTALSALASNVLGAEWIYPFDADDFLWLAPGPAIDLDAAGNFIRLPWLQSHPVERPIALFEDERFENLLSARHVSARSKTLFRWRSNCTVAAGAHSAYFDGKKPMAGIDGWDIGLCVVHYPVRSAAQFRKKVMAGTNALKIIENDGREGEGEGVHWRAAAELFEGQTERGDALLQAFWNLDVRSFVDVCRRLDVNPGSFSYLYEMLATPAISFPERAPVGVDRAHRLWSFRPKEDLSKPELLLRKLARITGHLLK